MATSGTTVDTVNAPPPGAPSCTIVGMGVVIGVGGAEVGVVGVGGGGVGIVGGGLVREGGRDG